MKILFTGASSSLGQRVLKVILENPAVNQVLCGIHKRKVNLNHPKIKFFPFDLEDYSSLSDLGDFDLAIHFAALSRAFKKKWYWQINYEGTINLAEICIRKNCKTFIFISSRCAKNGQGAYAESKRSAEQAIKQLPWDRLIIIRPSEIYGIPSQEGIDSLINLVKKYRVIPRFFGNPPLSFAPLHVDSFVNSLAQIIFSEFKGIQTIELSGAEFFDGKRLSKRLFKSFGGITIPIWHPGITLVNKFLLKIGIKIMIEDQFERMIATTVELPSINASIKTKFPN